jgi:hypothetical protein
MSCGYYAPHSDDEVVIFDDANNCLTMVDRLIDELGNNVYGFQYISDYGNYNKNSWGDFSEASQDYWYGGYGTAVKEVVTNEQTGEPSCYYCGCSELLESEYGDEFVYCPDCLSDIVVSKETTDKEEQEDISDDYDGSMEHNSMVNEYINKWAKTK